MHTPSDTKDDIWLEIGQQNHIMPDDYVSYTTARDKHWNITEAESHLLHQQLRKQYEKTNEMLRTFLKFDL